MIKVKFLLQKKYLKLIFFIIFCFISIKPVLFTCNYVIASYFLHIRGNITKASIYLYKAMHYNPAVNNIFGMDDKTITDYLLYSAVYDNSIRGLNKFQSPLINLERMKQKFRDNFYFQNLLNNLEKETNWENLDEITFKLLSEKSLNKITKTIFDRIGSNLNKDFMVNLIDFCRWKKNTELSSYLISKFMIQPNYPEEIFPLRIDYAKSIEKLGDILLSNYMIKKNMLGKNLLELPDFESAESFDKNWQFFNKADNISFADGSFTAGIDGSKEGKVLRLMGFFVKDVRGLKRPRGGIWYKEKVEIKKESYIFSFDYLTKSGKEFPSTWLGKGIRRHGIPHTEKKWKKYIFILNNSSFKVENLKPLIQVWGKGTLFIDNVYLAKIKNHNFHPDFSNILIFKNYEN